MYLTIFQIVIIDDVNAYAQFRDSLYGAPQEDILETLVLFSVPSEGVDDLYYLVYTWRLARRA